MAKSIKKIKARSLRKNGESIKKIAKQLFVSVSSVSLWCRDIILSEEQIKLLQQRSTDPYYGKKADYLRKKREELNIKINKLKLKGMKDVGKLTKRELFLSGIALYWGEGFKKDNQVGLATSNDSIAKFFIVWLKQSFNINNESLILRVTINISHKERADEIEKHWSSVLNISLKNFSKPFFQKSVWKKEYENKNEYYGVLRIKVRKSIDMLRKIYGFLEGFSLNVFKKTTRPTVCKQE